MHYLRVIIYSKYDLKLYIEIIYVFLHIMHLRQKTKYLQHLHLVDSFGSYTVLHDDSYSYDLETNLISSRKF